MSLEEGLEGGVTEQPLLIIMGSKGYSKMRLGHLKHPIYLKTTHVPTTAEAITLIWPLNHLVNHTLMPMVIDAVQSETLLQEILGNVILRFQPL